MDEKDVGIRVMERMLSKMEGLLAGFPSMVELKSVELNSCEYATPQELPLILRDIYERVPSCICWDEMTSRGYCLFEVFEDLAKEIDDTEHRQYGMQLKAHFELLLDVVTDGPFDYFQWWD